MINVIKEDTNKCLSEFQENLNKELNEIKTMQNVKEESNKDIEILQKIKLKF
jgi:hypothetical protein